MSKASDRRLTHDIDANALIYFPPVHRRMAADVLCKWAVERWNAEVKDRPLVNVHRRILDDTWRQVIRYAGGNPDKLIGPDHDTLVLQAQTRNVQAIK